MVALTQQLKVGEAHVKWTVWFLRSLLDLVLSCLLHLYVGFRVFSRP